MRVGDKGGDGGGRQMKLRTASMRRYTVQLDPVIDVRVRNWCQVIQTTDATGAGHDVFRSAISLLPIIRQKHARQMPASRTPAQIYSFGISAIARYMSMNPGRSTTILVNDFFQRCRWRQ